ncbi:MAG: hypothetical protein PVG63_01680 [Anaerolineales bacterium]|jgi:hypothetical protein
MNKEKYLTVGWNNILTVALGVPTVIFVAIAFSGTLWTSQGGMIGLSIIGVLY